MRIVVDASVAIKWVVRDPNVEPNVDRAIALLRGMRARSFEALVPPHFIAEVVAVIARERPQRLPITFGILRSLPFQVITSDAVYQRATTLTISLKHHLFDTLYHAVALETGATLVTADRVYFAKAKGLGGIEPLAAFNA